MRCAFVLICMFMFGLSSVLPASERAPSVGAQVLAVDGTPVGHVSGILRDVNGHIYRISITTSAPLGFGARMITVRDDVFLPQGNAVWLRLTVPEVNVLPTIMSEPFDGR